MGEFKMVMIPYKGVKVPYYIFNLLMYGNASLPEDVSESYIKEKYGLDVEIKHSTQDSGNTISTGAISFHIATLIGGQLTVRGVVVK